MAIQSSSKVNLGRLKRKGLDGTKETGEDLRIEEIKYLKGEQTGRTDLL
jgi:hypothetical protein